MYKMTDRRNLKQGWLFIITFIVGCMIMLQNPEWISAANGIRDREFVNIIDKFEIYVDEELLLETRDLSSIPVASKPVSYEQTLTYKFSWSDKKLIANQDEIQYGDKVSIKIPMSEGVRYSGNEINDPIYDGNGNLIGHFTVKRGATEYTLGIVFDNQDYVYSDQFNYEGSFYIHFKLNYDEKYDGSEVQFSLNVNNEVSYYKLKPTGSPYPDDYNKWGELERNDGVYTYDADNDRYFTDFTLRLNQSFSTIANTANNPMFLHDKVNNTISDIKYELTVDGLPNIFINEYTYADSLKDIVDKKNAFANDYFTYSLIGNAQVCTLYSTDPNTTYKNKDGTSAYSPALVAAIQFDASNPDNFAIDFGFLGDPITHPIFIKYRTSMSGVGVGDLLNGWKNIPGAKDYLDYIKNEDANSMSISVNGTVINTSKSGSYTSFSTAGAEAFTQHGIVRVNKYDEANPTEKLAGAEFTIYKDNDEVVCTMITDADGGATSPNLAPGDYYIVETKAPKGYVLDNQKHTFTLKSAGNESSLLKIYDVPNSHKPLSLPTIAINKVSNDKTIIDAKMVFELRDGTSDEAAIIGTLDSGNGYRLGQLATGTYYLYEKIAPEGYLALEKYAAKFTVMNDNTIVVDEVSGGTTYRITDESENQYTFKIPNERKESGLIFTKKIAGLPAEIIASIPDGAFSFSIVGPDGYADTFTLPQKGSWTYVADGLVMGEYVITEVGLMKNPTGYTWAENGAGRVVVTVDGGESAAGAITNSYSKDAENPTDPKEPTPDDYKPGRDKEPVPTVAAPKRSTITMNPKTGDGNDSIYSRLVMTSLAGIGVIMVWRKKQREEL